VRLTGDCPLIDPVVIDAVVGARLATGADYSSNIDPPTYPDGLDCECFSAAALARCHRQATDRQEREHVTLWMRSDKAALSRINVSLPFDASGTRLTVDYPDDLDAVRRVLAFLPPGTAYDCYDLLSVIASHPELRTLNPHLRNEALLSPPRASAEPTE
jgi:spore coat polysaccharide biosynthesis protein SpsF (cytidylyltransferase family)